jgi:predicted ABC-class ATPase
MTKILQGHKYAERLKLKLEEKGLVCEMTNNMVLPRNTMSTPKKIRRLSETTIKHI